MNDSNKKPSENTTRRGKAEEYLQSKPSDQTIFSSDADILKLMHELQVHHIELELQNEELQLAKEKAESDNKKFTSIYDFAPVGYFTITSDGSILELNHKSAEMLGMARSILINRNLRFFIAEISLPIFNEFLLKIFGSKSSQSCEVTMISKANTSVILYVEGVISEDEQQCLISAMDISTIKQAEEKMRNSENKYRRLFEAAKDGILILDAQSGMIIDVNPFLIEKIGYTYEELLGKELWEIGTFKNIVASKEAFIELKKNEYIRFDDMPLEAKTGEQVSVEFVSNVYLVDGIKVIQCNIRDITERKLAQDIIKERETRLRELNATKDRFFSIIAHDLKNPFASVIGFSKVLGEKIREKDYEVVEEYAGYIQSSALRAMSLLTNLFEWSLAQTGKMNFKPELIDMVELISEIVELSNDFAHQKSITISTESPQNIYVYIDRNMISSVLRNLISNAMKFTNPEGKIVISAMQIHNELLVTVSDNGVGMSDNTLNKLFRLDEIISSPGTKKEKGTGLGLILCKEFIDRHNGKIWAESKLSIGSKFSFTIPLSQ
ncbi:MAG: PAS domain-containing sensor histidine kinase [Mariniphaga sp.]|nr:PAS domain-containing sensor histidine kinase [Mariniphaga sp.]